MFILQESIKFYPDTNNQVYCDLCGFHFHLFQPLPMISYSRFTKPFPYVKFSNGLIVFIKHLFSKISRANMAEFYRYHGLSFCAPSVHYLCTICAKSAHKLYINCTGSTHKMHIRYGYGTEETPARFIVRVFLFWRGNGGC